MDSSVYLRILLSHPGAVRLPEGATQFTSAITRVEIRRVLFRLRARGKLSAEELETKLAECDALLSACRVVPCDQSIVERAGEPLASPLGSLDAIHLASALSAGAALVTHNVELRIAARACHLEVCDI